MIDSRTLIPIGCLLVTGALAVAQTLDPDAPPAPPAPPVAARVARPAAPRPFAFAQTPTAPPAAPAPAAAPTPVARPAIAPRAPVDILDPVELDRIRDQAMAALDQAKAAQAAGLQVGLDQDTLDRIREQSLAALGQVDAARPVIAAAAQLDQDALDRIREQARDAVEAARGQLDAARPLYQLTHPDGVGIGVGAGVGGNFDLAFNRNFNFNIAPQINFGGRRGGSDDRVYDAGLNALDSHRWDEALEEFNQVASHAGPRADGAWYWKAYTLNRLGKRDEALAAIAELRKSFASSRWLDEAKALEIEVRQGTGKPVSPESESDEELKLMALNGLMQSDPDRAIPLVENILKGPGSHKLKSRALFVLAQNQSPRALQIVEQIAKGGGNPDLQVKAIQYLGQRRRQSNNSQNQLLMEIYNSSNDVRVKGAILDALRDSRDTDRLGQIAKTEKSSELRERTYDQLGQINGQPELWQLYQTETTPDGKIAILRYMHRNGNADRLVDVIKKETDSKVRRAAIDALASQDSGAPERLVSLYSSEQDPQLRQEIINRLSDQRNAKYLVDLARAEKDQQLKLKIVQRLSNMHSKEASDYLTEILSK